MKGALSQSEIDVLLKAIESGDVNPEEVQKETKKTEAKKYDFRRPNKFSKDQLRTLQMIHENFVRLSSNFLSGFLRIPTRLKMVSIEQLTYEEFLVSIPTTTLLTIFEMPPLNGSAIMEFNPVFTYTLVDILLGGHGRQGESKHIFREFSDIELGVLEKLNQKILDNFAYAWTDIMEFTPRVISLESNPQFNQIISPNETVAILTFSVQLGGDEESLINLCLPYMTLEKVAPKLTAHYWFSNSHQNGDSDEIQNIKKSLNSVNLELEALCGETTLSVKEFLELAVDDVIVLEQKSSAPMKMKVSGSDKFLFYPGMHGQKYAASIADKKERG